MSRDVQCAHCTALLIGWDPATPPPPPTHPPAFGLVYEGAIYWPAKKDDISLKLPGTNIILIRENRSQSRQTASLFLQSSELGLPTPSPGFRGGHTRLRGGVGESQFGRGDIHCGTLGIYVLCQTYSVCSSSYFPFTVFVNQNLLFSITVFVCIIKWRKKIPAQVNSIHLWFVQMNEDATYLFIF
jgi:hypothetical protein